MEPPSPIRPDKLEALQKLLDSARQIANDLGADPLVARWLSVFARMPAVDRETIVGVVEREVDARLLTDVSGESLTAMRLRPNPGARLYARIIDQQPDAPNRQEAIVAAVRAMRMFHRAVGPSDEVWAANMLGALRELDPPGREGIARFCRLLLTQIDLCTTETIA
jgi:hypothetical protein